MAYINVDVNIDISEYLDEVSTEDLISELEDRKVDTKNIVDVITINDFKTDFEKRKYICKILDLNEFDNDNKQRILNEIENLF